MLAVDFSVAIFVPVEQAAVGAAGVAAVTVEEPYSSSRVDAEALDARGRSTSGTE